MEGNENFDADVQKKIDALPENVRKYVYSADMSKVIQDIGAKYKLHIDQIGALESEAAAVMIGLTKPEEFAENISDALDIENAQSQAIAKDVNDLLFMKIRESMKADYKPSPAPIISSAPRITELERPQMPARPVSAPPISSIPTPTSPSTMIAATPRVMGLTTPVVTKPASPPISPEMHEAEKVLSAPVVQVPASPQATPGAALPETVSREGAVDAAQPLSYKSDPYREPVE